MPASPPVNKILVPLDGSRRAEAILPHVARLAGCTGAEVLLLQVIEPAYVPLDPQGFMPELDFVVTEQREKEAAGYLVACREELAAQGVKVDCCVESGPVVETIIEVAGREKASLIAMASHGRSGLARALYGSVAEGVLQHADFPLYLIRALKEPLPDPVQA